VDAATVLWISPAGSARPEKADRALEEWARSHGLQLVAPGVERTPRLRIDESLADSVEEELEKARDASSALDVDGAERSLARAEGILRQHPELPQGAWLMAEVERGWARRWASVPPKALDRASEAWARARGLDGGREPGLGEVASPSVEADVSFQLLVEGGGDARLDGRPVVQGAVKSQPGEHQLTIARDGSVVWAGWVGVGEGSLVRVSPPEPAPCSAEELGRVTTESSHVRADGVTCPLWVAVVPGAAERLLVAICRKDRCGGLQEWNASGGVPVLPPGAVASPWPAWATWTFVGLGAVAIVGTSIGIDAAFHSGVAPSNPFTVGGAHGAR
jgi:hypothetical protein